MEFEAEHYILPTYQSDLSGQGHFTPADLSRRQFVIGLGAFTGVTLAVASGHMAASEIAAAAGPVLTQLNGVQARVLSGVRINGQEIEAMHDRRFSMTPKIPWRSPHSYPIFWETAWRHRLWRLEEEEGPLHHFIRHHDSRRRLRRHHHDHPAWTWQHDFTRRFRQTFPDRQHWAAHHFGLAAATIYDREPLIKDHIKIGLLAAKWTGIVRISLRDMWHIRQHLEGKNLPDLEGKNIPVVVVLPDSHGVRRKRAAFGISHDDWVLVRRHDTDLFETFPSRAIESAWLVVPDGDERADDPIWRSYAEQWRNPYLDHNLINQLVYPA